MNSSWAAYVLKPTRHRPFSLSNAYSREVCVPSRGFAVKLKIRRPQDDQAQEHPLVPEAGCRGDDCVELRAGAERGREGGQGGREGHDECETGSGPGPACDEDGRGEIVPEHEEDSRYRENQGPATLNEKEHCEDFR